jgi:hypothetical protein
MLMEWVVLKWIELSLRIDIQVVARKLHHTKIHVIMFALNARKQFSMMFDRMNRI